MRALLEAEKPTVEFRGKRYRLDLSFDTVLLVQMLYDEEVLTNEEKIDQALRMLVKQWFKVWLLDETARAQLLEQITKEHIMTNRRPTQKQSAKLLDFQHDSDYIYASFRQAYGMDLTRECGKLPWKRFLDLLDGLPEKTKLKEVMRIRAMEIPKPTRYNQKEIQNIIQLKAYYALPVKGGGGQQGLDLLFDTLARGARKM